MPANSDVVRLNKVLPRVEAAADYGLTHVQANERLRNGYANFKPDSAEKTVGQVVRGHVLTYFNLVFFLLGLVTLLWGSIGNIFFLNIVIINTVIGIVQELRSRAALSKLTFMTSPKATVIRDGEAMVIPSDETVLDDIVIFSSGQQIFADAIVLDGECNVNEALVTGESDEIAKTRGTTLLSGSFIVSGECKARLDKVGRDSFVAQLTIDAKKTRNKVSSGGMVSALKRLVQVIGIIIVPLGIAMFVLQYNALLPDSLINGIGEIGQYAEYRADALLTSVDRTVGALVGMIPDGLYLLVSITLTVSVLRLAKKRTLIQEMGCVETLARVDVFCVDKTGTITVPEMEVKGIIPLQESRVNMENINTLIADYAGNLPAENETMAALQNYINTAPRRSAIKTLPFSSALKYGGVSFRSNESYLLGAPEMILKSSYSRYKDEIEPHSAQGFRVLLLAHYDADIDGELIERRITPIALILLNNRIRPEAPDTFKFFTKQGVRIVVISGDNPMTVAQIAHDAGIVGADRYIDATQLTTERQIRRAVKEFIVFGRVTPDQKRKLVRAFKREGHTVAMTGDGVNDVLAMKDANCSIAMASGSEVASQVADIVLLDSDFSAMTQVVMEGRRVINNLQRSASLFIMKNIFSFLFAGLITIPIQALFPLEGMQFTLYNLMVIGLPSFVLAMEPNFNILRGKFLVNVFRRAIPAGVTSFIALVAVFILYTFFDISIIAMSTMSVIAITFVGFMMIFRLCIPFNPMRIVLMVVMLVGFIIGLALFSGAGEILPQEFVRLTTLSGGQIGWTVAVCATSIPIFMLMNSLIKQKRS